MYLCATHRRLLLQQLQRRRRTDDGPIFGKKVAFSIIRSISTRLRRSADPTRLVDLEEFTPDRIRNFGIVAHVDHGKSTLADRLLELTGVIDPGVEQAQMLDKLQVERERGITVKAQTCSMLYKVSFKNYDHLFNLIDTPGHADFSFEVARSMSASTGILLLIAANQGVQAQTIANFWLAFEHNLPVIPVINKIDLAMDKVPKVEAQLKNLFEIQSTECLRISAKTGHNVLHVLEAILHRIPPPEAADRSAPFRALVFDSFYEQFRGAIAFIVVKEGGVERGQRIRTFHGQKDYEVVEVGIMHPEMTPVMRLFAGQVGYVIANMKTVKEAAVGETLHDCQSTATVVPLPGFRPVKPTVYAGLFPVDAGDFENMKTAVERLAMNDPAVQLSLDSSPALGLGWRIGFLGVLHMEVFGARLDQEYDAAAILTAPSVEFRARIKDNETIRKKRYEGKSEISIVDPSKFPDPGDVEKFLEPMIALKVLAPIQYLSVIQSLCVGSRGDRGEVTMLDEDRFMLQTRLPLAEVVVDFFEQLKRLTSGYASFDYEPDGYDEVPLVKVNVTLNDRSVDEFAQICPGPMAADRAKLIIGRLKEEIPRQQFEVILKATVGTSKKTLSQAIIPANRKDFSQTLKGNFGGGGMERLNKKLSHQRAGKAHMKAIGRVLIPREAFINVLRKN